MKNTKNSNKKEHEFRFQIPEDEERLGPLFPLRSQEYIGEVPRVSADQSKGRKPIQENGAALLLFIEAITHSNISLDISRGTRRSCRGCTSTTIAILPVISTTAKAPVALSTSSTKGELKKNFKRFL